MCQSRTGRRFAVAAVVWLAATAGPGCSQMDAGRADEPLVAISEVNPRIIVDIRYATAENFMHQPLYPVNRCLLRESVARRLSRVQEDLEAQGLGLKVFDAYRPLSVQRRMWAVLPDPQFVADPARGSRHNRGAAVDVTLVDAHGRELAMPSGYDEFSERARTDYQGSTSIARANRNQLIRAMQRRGFKVLASEWWHFDAPGWQRYAVLDVPLDEVPSSQAASQPGMD